MRTSISLEIHSALGTFSTLQVHPEMTAKELSQLVCASSLLHNSPKDIEPSRCRNIPLAVVSKQRNLMMDYLLLSTATPLSKINYIANERRHENMRFLQLNKATCKRQSLREEVDKMMIEVIYSVSQRKEKSILLQRYVRVEAVRKSLVSPVAKPYSLSREI